MKVQKQQKIKKPTKLELVTLAATQNYAHNSTQDIVRRRCVLACEMNAADSEIRELSNRIADARARSAQLEAQMAGLEKVVAKR